jgi:predicted S18 family serine protease
MNVLKTLICCSAGIMLLAACGTTNPPTQKLTQTETVIGQAAQIGAGDYAPLELREARRKLDEARRAYDRKDYDQAARLAEQARVDAELAQIKTLSGKAEKAVTELRESIRMLKEEIEMNRNRNDR